MAGLVAGAVSASLGEYAWLNTRRDTATALVDKEGPELVDTPEEELAELYEAEVQGAQKK